jgi:RND family efflux transporter MFP subunit
MLWLAGAFSAKVEAPRSGSGSAATAGTQAPASTRSVEAKVRRVPRHDTAVGTIESVRKIAVASKLLARVLEVNVQAGQRVRSGAVLIRLDDEDLRARLGQAQANLEAAKANAEQARIEFERVERLFQGNNASQIERERAETALKTAQAELARATQAHREGETVLEYATVTSPIDGTVIDKRVQAGDTVTPGQPLVELYDPDRMQLVASVRESLTQRLEVGQTIDVRVDALDRVCQGTISEIVPEAESASRTFSVKVTGPCPPGIYSGMFGRLLIPLDEQEVLVVPESAVRRVGQLDMVQILADGRLQRRAVQLGRRFGEDVEVLSGLRAGERVALPEGA